MALTIVVPVLIHLWNIREGKTLKIGSVLLLRQVERQRASSFRIREWLLLALRCLLLLLLVMLLAGPYRLTESKTGKETGWVVIEKRYRKELHTLFGRQIDSLTSAGFGLHYMEQDFPPAKPEELVVEYADSAAADLPYWASLQQLHRRVPAGIPVYLYTGNRLNRFTGKRPLLAMNLHWQVITPVDSVHTGLVAAYLSSPDSIRIIKATGRPAFVSYAAENIPAAGARQKGYTTSFDGGKLFLSQPDNQPLQVDTSTLRVAIFAEGYPNDAVYLQAAIRAVQQFTRRRIEVQRITHEKASGSAPDWLFWLSDKPVPFIEHCNIFRYVTGKEQVYYSWIVQNNRESTGEPVTLYKRVSNSSAGPDDVIVWQDGYGHPILARSEARGSAFFNFYSRFNPQWTDLPWSSRFPVWLLPLLLNKEQVSELKQDTRTLDKSQIIAAVLPADRKRPAAAKPEKTDLKKWIWVAAFLVFFLERSVTYRRKNRSA